MSSFAQRCGLHDADRDQAVHRTTKLIDAAGLELVRVAWCDLHGVTRGKTLTPPAVRRTAAACSSGSAGSLPA